MDDEFDIDELDDELEDELDEEIDDDSDDKGEGLEDSEVEVLGSLDGEFDDESGDSYSQYGASVDFDELTDEQKDLYDNAYNSSLEK